MKINTFRDSRPGNSDGVIRKYFWVLRMSQNAQKNYRDAGVAMVEMAIVLPLLVLVIFGSFEFYSVFSNELILSEAVSKAAATTSKIDTSSQLCQEMLEQALRSELQRWNAEDQLSEITAESVSSIAPGMFGEAFAFTVRLRVSCLLCRLFPAEGDGNTFRLSRRAVVQLDAGEACQPPVADWGTGPWS